MFTEILPIVVLSLILMSCLIVSYSRSVCKNSRKRRRMQCCEFKVSFDGGKCMRLMITSLLTGCAGVSWA